MTRREKILSVTALLIIWFGAGYRFWCQPLAKQIQAVEQQITAAESQARPADIKLWSNADQLAEPDEKSRFLDYEVEQRDQEKQIPKQRDLPELLEQLVAWADETGVRLAGFKMEPEKTENVKNTNNPDKANNADKANNSGNVENTKNKEVGFRFIQMHTQIEGRYAQTIDFLVKLEQAERLIRVDRLELILNDRAKSSQSVSPGSTSLSPGRIYNPALQAQISFSVYYLPD